MKAKPIEVPPPTYPEAERESAVEGRVRVEIELDATGAVKGARVVSALGPAFDAAALEAARRGRFEAATRCGRAVESKFVLAIRFEL